VTGTIGALEENRATKDVSGNVDGIFTTVVAPDTSGGSVGSA
jgi:hypothetical protein